MAPRRDLAARRRRPARRQPRHLRATAPRSASPACSPADSANKAVALRRLNDYVASPQLRALNSTAPITLEAWIKPTALPAAGVFASIATKAESYSLQFNGRRLEFTIIQSGTRRRLQAPAGAIVAGQTYHVVGTYDGTTQRLYINGAQVASAPLTGAITANTNALDIGSWNGARSTSTARSTRSRSTRVALLAARVSRTTRRAPAHERSGPDRQRPEQPQRHRRLGNRG